MFLKIFANKKLLPPDTAKKIILSTLGRRGIVFHRAKTIALRIAILYVNMLDKDTIRRIAHLAINTPSKTILYLLAELLREYRK